jgi:virginiamycin B lyase
MIRRFLDIPFPDIPRLALLGLLSAAALTTAALTAPPTRAQEASELPPGPGRDIVATNCTLCHDAGRILAAGHTREEWQTVIAMMRHAGAQIPAGEEGVLLDYLSAHFPPRDEPKPVILPGPVRVTFTEWTLPERGERPHDPLAARDGSLWYTAQMVNRLGRVDPATGAIREYPTGADLAGPHGLAEDREGRIWFTANFSGAIGRLDPGSGALARFPMPDPRARDPHTPVFDAHGTLWFTVQGGNFVGKLDPASGHIDLVPLPAPRSLPYGIAIAPDGVPYFVEFGANRIGRIDPGTLHITEFTIPDPKARPRRIAITADGVVWASDYARGVLIRFDPKTNSFRDYPSPSGPRSAPYGITALGNVVWYSESGTRPNTLVRFDPKTGAMQSFAIPSGGGVIRNMMPTPSGGLALADAGLDRVAGVKNSE